MTTERKARLKLGMVGGGQGAFIGAVHRIAARMDDRFQLVAGALSSDPARAAASAAELGIAPDRSYASFEEMARAEAAREDGIDAVAIVTPNHLHAGPSIAFLNAGIHVICDKPLAASATEAEAMKQAAATSSARFFLTHNYTGYPLLRQARAMVARGDLGRIRLVQAEYAQDWLTDVIEQEGHKQAAWRTDPAQSGAGAIGDIGTHAFNLACFVSGLVPQSLSAELHSFGPGRQVDDNAHILLRYAEGARGMLWASQIAVGCENDLRLRIYGDKGGLEWEHQDPNQMRFTRFGEPKQILTRGGAGVGPDWTRVPPGHPEGYLEGFATLYTDIAEVIETGIDNPMLPGLQAGLDGMWFISAAQTSSADGGAWIPR
ncbi:Gfo/Idh/MocA family protein [Phaeobacter gallaeciensis]|uniref:Oxidoreductase, GFO/IDH/MOCA family n=1 Tax=Phaeobacter gallaeciensis TaxID=60890 RepID=A0AAC9ZCV0_9RHOB|nr:Gfo/Idh/MocA family oxidoreductase [Phaeobacter gallaeciensis]AHD11974.1 putative dehydrogenase [Phaeobacter gallaeciensis DSM 26640]ATE95240.1 putative oxidoreductase, GFO/IDH/MOCA family [Phaeobacter gallaeciensis]ATE99631.1 putative oxidoreductase, GFO/IDH/MOCA family [Phaeobacter gallaeciensis]ATF03945.1 putative oxidoreductase, GFO/IDH/MOCA family [Phaeobacter gallaeciensis]ATF08221.1 putative oxidoreductase, GFO/IDH/MOCA family [Phaeobacter gallaeciensis]